MNLYRLSQTKNNGYDTYDSCVVAADTEAEAQGITPDGQPFGFGGQWTSWADNRNQVAVRLIGVAVEGTPAGVICASFNAG